MKNYEKYMEELIDSLGVNGVNCNFLHRRVFHEVTCNGRNCNECNVRFKEWLKEEYNPQIDWSKVPVDTPVIIPNGKKRHFRKYDDNKVFVFADGTTSWSCPMPNSSSWIIDFSPQLVKLAREEDIEKYSI